MATAKGKPEAGSVQDRGKSTPRSEIGAAIGTPSTLSAAPRHTTGDFYDMRGLMLSADSLSGIREPLRKREQAEMEAEIQHLQRTIAELEERRDIQLATGGVGGAEAMRQHLADYTAPQQPLTSSKSDRPLHARDDEIDSEDELLGGGQMADARPEEMLAKTLQHLAKAEVARSEPKKMTPPIFSGGEKSQVTYDNWSLVVEHSVPTKWRSMLSNPPPAKDAISTALKAKLYAYLVPLLDTTSSVFEEAQHCTGDGVELWQRLRRRFTLHGGAQQFVVQQEIQRRTWKPTDTVDTFGRDITTLQRRMRAAGGHHDDAYFVSHVAANAPPYLQADAMSAVQDGLRLDQALQLMRATEMLRKPASAAAATLSAAVTGASAPAMAAAKGLSPSSLATIAQLPEGLQPIAAMFVKAAKDYGRGRGRGRGRGGRGRGNGRGRGRGKDSKEEAARKEEARATGACFNCGKTGHIAAKCTQQKQKPKPDVPVAMAGSTVREVAADVLEMVRNSPKPARPVATNDEDNACGDVSDEQQAPTAEQLRASEAEIVKEYAACLAQPSAIPCAAAYDSGCGNHVFNDPKLFVDLDCAEATIRVTAKLKAANGQQLRTLGVGTVRLRTIGETATNGMVELRDVYYSPDACVNLISHSKLIRPDGSTPSGMQFSDGPDGPALTLINGEKTRLLDRASVLWLGAWAEPNDNLSAMIVDEAATIDEALAAPAIGVETTAADEVAMTAYRRLHLDLGHASTRNTKSIAKLLGIKRRPCDKRVCQTCVTMKGAHKPIGQVATRSTKKPGELVHFDIKGKLLEDSKGYQYVAMYTDDFTRYARGYAMHAKYEVAATTEKFITDSVTAPQTAIPIGSNTTIHSDNDSNMLDAATAEVLVKHAIKLRTTPLHTPQRNGVAERL